jgi:hypothetical protein
MWELSRKTWALLRAHPILLLPLACVSVSEFLLEWAQKVVVRKAVTWLTTTHSALGFENPVGSALAVKKALTELLPFEVAFRVLILCAYFAGFVLTAGLARSLVGCQRCNWANAMALLRQRIFRVLLLGLALFIGFSLSAIVGSAIINIHKFTFLRNDFSFEILLRVELCVMFACLAWIFVPPSLRLIMQEPKRPITPVRKLQGRMSAVVASLVYVALYAYIRSVTSTVDFALEDHPLLRSLAVWPGLAVLGDLPFALLWIFLAVLVYQDFETPEIPSPS